MNLILTLFLLIIILNCKEEAKTTFNKKQILKHAGYNIEKNNKALHSEILAISEYRVVGKISGDPELTKK